MAVPNRSVSSRVPPCVQVCPTFPCGNVTVELANVAISCSGLPFATPCALGRERNLFSCTYVGSHESWTAAGLSPRLESQQFGGDTIGIDVLLECPTPSLEKVMELGAYDGAGQPVVATLSITFLEIKKDSSRDIAIPFVGRPGGDAVTFEGIFTPPSPPYTIPPNYALSCHSDDEAFHYVLEVSSA